MDRQATLLATQAAPAGETTRLQGPRLVVVRTAAFALVALTLIVYALALPGLTPRLATPCIDINSCIVTPQQVAPLGRLSITPDGLAMAVTLLSCLAILLVSSVAALLLWRRSDDWMALLVAVTLILLPSVLTPIVQGLPTSLLWLNDVYDAAAFLALYLLIGLFPSGRFVPRWLWLPILLDMLLEWAPLPPPPTPQAQAIVGALGIFALLFNYASLIGGQIYRYRRFSTPAQRQQTKWVVSGIILTLVVNQLFWQPIVWIPALQRPDSLYTLLAGPDSFLMIVILATSFAIAILRYRLYDIDVIIRRTLIYGSLTLILAAVYVMGVVGVQSIVNSIAHTSGRPASPILIVITTLLIAALFQPLRRRIQRFIDRRFYRSRYDTRKTLDSFSATLRQEVDLSMLTGRLVEVVTETMQPEHVSLWLQGRRENRS